jgi:hypothetical protein
MFMDGIIYCVRNPLFPHLVKIGKTTKDSFSERVNSTFVPEDFVYIFEIRVREVDAVEQSVHNALDEFRYITKSSRRKTEFFYDTPVVIPRAKSVIKAFEIEDVSESSQLELESDETDNKRAKRKTFAEAGLPIGTKIKFIGKGGRHGEEFEIANNISSIMFDGEITTRSRAAALLEKGRLAPMAGSIYFEYNGKTISDIVDEVRSNGSC